MSVRDTVVTHEQSSAPGTGDKRSRTVGNSNTYSTSTYNLATVLKICSNHLQGGVIDISEKYPL